MASRKNAAGIAGTGAVVYTVFTWWLDVNDRVEDPGVLGGIARFVSAPPPGVTIFVLGFGLFFIWVYATNRVEEIKDEFRQRRLSRNQTFSNQLLGLWKHGVDDILNNDGIQGAGGTGGDAAFILWTIYKSQWMSDVLALVRAHPCTTEEIMDIETLGDVPLGSYHTHSGVNGHLSNEAERLRRIKAIAGRYSEGGAPTPSAPHT